MQCREFKYPNATIRVHRPDVADDERVKRMAEIKRSAEILLREVIRNEHSVCNTNGN
jgi:hypothetical protein